MYFAVVLGFFERVEVAKNSLAIRMRENARLVDLPLLLGGELTERNLARLAADLGTRTSVWLRQEEGRAAAEADGARPHAVRNEDSLYGLLRPLDRLQPYRLEMGTRLKTRRGSSLYDFWGDRISKALNADAEGHADPTLVNLASQEYFGAVDAKALKLPVVNIHFREEKDGESRIISFFAKKARGTMARYAIENRIDRAETLFHSRP